MLYLQMNISSSLGTYSKVTDEARLLGTVTYSIGSFNSNVRPLQTIGFGAWHAIGVSLVSPTIYFTSLIALLGTTLSVVFPGIE